MSSHIKQCKKAISHIVKSIKESGCVLTGVAFVGYKDWCDGDDHFEVLDFTTDISAFEAFVGKITATGGGDWPEDVLGGLWTALQRLSWNDANAGTRVLIHMADAPPHGRHFHNSRGRDDYPDGHPNDKTA